MGLLVFNRELVATARWQRWCLVIGVFRWRICYMLIDRHASDVLEYYQKHTEKDAFLF
jgi:hypothetical protein